MLEQVSVQELEAKKDRMYNRQHKEFLRPVNKSNKETMQVEQSPL